MGVRESIYTVWGARMGGWHRSVVTRSRHCVEKVFYKGHIEMYVGFHHHLAQTCCLKKSCPLLGTATPPIHPNSAPHLDTLVTTWVVTPKNKNAFLLRRNSNFGDKGKIYLALSLLS